MIKFRCRPVSEIDPDHKGSDVFCDWCEYHGMVGLSAPNREELRVKIEDELRKRAKEAPWVYPEIAKAYPNQESHDGN